MPRLQHYHTKTKYISGIAWSPDGEHLAIISRQDQSLEIVQAKGVAPVSDGIYGMSINAVAWSPDKRFIAIGGGEAEATVRNRSGVLVLDVNTRQVVRALATPEAVRSLAWSTHDTLIGIAARDVTIWNVRQQKAISKIRAKNGFAANY